MKAKVFLWPLMSKPQMKEQEAELFYAGYTEKKKVTVGKHTVWVCT